MEYSVGQILYVVMKNDNKVVPMQVCEEITRKTLEGLKIDYVVKVGSEDKGSTLTVAQIEGDIFDSPEQAIQVLTDKAHSSIVRLVNLAQEKAKIWYEMRPAKIERVALESEDEVMHINQQPTGAIKVRLSDGTMANVKLPAESV